MISSLHLRLRDAPRTSTRGRTSYSGAVVQWYSWYYGTVLTPETRPKMATAASWSFAARTAHAIFTVVYAVYLYLYMVLFWPFIVLLGPTWRLVSRMYGTSSHGAADRVPDPTDILGLLGLGPPRSFMGDDSIELNNKVCEVIASQIARGGQLGVCVAAYHKGRLVCSCGGGVMRPIDGSGPWQPVEQNTLFLCNSLTKGMVATAFMTLVDENVINLDAPVSSVGAECTGAVCTC